MGTMETRRGQVEGHEEVIVGSIETKERSK